MRVHRPAGQDHAIGTKGIGAANDRSGVTRVTDLGADDGQAYVLVRQLVAGDLSADGEDSLTGDSVGQGTDVLVSQ